MYRKKIGSVTRKENEDILQLYERKLALQELLSALREQAFTEEEEKRMNNKILSDLEKTKVNFEKWWSNMIQKYQWKQVEREQLGIDFNTNEIFLLNNSK